MKRSAALLALLLHATAAPAGTRDPPSQGCQLMLAGAAGTLSVASRMGRRQAWSYSLAWTTPAFDSGLRIEIMPWWADTVLPPGDRAEALVSLRVPEGVRRGALRLELRAANGRGRASGSWQVGGPSAMLALRWGRLRSLARGGPIAAVIADRAGRVLLRAEIQPDQLEAPARAVDAGRPRWEALLRMPGPPCPEGAEEVEWLRVSGG